MTLAARRAERVASVTLPGLTLTRTRLVLGVDPGQSGALVWLTEGGAAMYLLMPATPKVGVDLAGVLPNLELYRPAYAVVERAQAFPGQGAAATASYMRDYGGILGLLIALRIPYETVHPATWHSQLCGKRRKGETRNEAKARALAVVRQRLPSFELPSTKAARLGVVDAACVALWGIQHGGAG